MRRLVSAYVLIVLLFALTILVGQQLWPETYPHMVDRVSASVVRLTYETDPEHVCSGVVIAPTWVLTAEHCTAPIIYVDGVKSTTLLQDKFYDLALLSVETKKHPIELRDRRVERFEPLTAIGYAFGWTKLMVWQESVVLVNSSPYEGIATGVMMQGEPIKGMSGGPIVDQHGRLVALTQQGNSGVGYGVGVQLIRAFLLGVD